MMLSTVEDIDINIMCLLDELELVNIYHTNSYFKQLFNKSRFINSMKCIYSYIPEFNNGEEFYRLLLTSIEMSKPYNKTIYFKTEAFNAKNLCSNLKSIELLELDSYSVFLSQRDGFEWMKLSSSLSINEICNTQHAIPIIINYFNILMTHNSKIIIDMSGESVLLLSPNKFIIQSSTLVETDIKKFLFSLPIKQYISPHITHELKICDLLFGNLLDGDNINLFRNRKRLITCIHTSEGINQVVQNYKDNYDIINQDRYNV